MVFGAGVMDVIVGLMYFMYSLARMLPSVSYHGTWGGIIVSSSSFVNFIYLFFFFFFFFFFLHIL